MKTGSIPLYCPQSWKERSTVITIGTSTMPAKSRRPGRMSAQAAALRFIGGTAAIETSRRPRESGGPCGDAYRRLPTVDQIGVQSRRMGPRFRGGDGKFVNALGL
jgi:hypothetical protein